MNAAGFPTSSGGALTCSPAGCEPGLASATLNGLTPQAVSPLSVIVFPCLWLSLNLDSVTFQCALNFTSLFCQSFLIGIVFLIFVFIGGGGAASEQKYLAIHKLN